MAFSIIPDRFHLYRYAIRAPRTILVLCLLTALASAFLARNLVITDLYSGLLPEGSESAANLHYAEENFGELGFLVVVIEGIDPARTENFARVFAGEIEKKPEVHYVRTPWDFDFLKEKKWLYVDLKDLADIEKRLDQALNLQRQGVNFVFSDLMDFADKENLPDLTFKDIREKYKKRWGTYLTFNGESTNQDFIALWIKTGGHKMSLQEKQRFVDSIKTLELQVRNSLPDSHDVSAGYTGSYQTSLETIDTTRREITVISLAATLILIGVLIAYFRKPRQLLYIGLPLLTGILWTGGLASLILGKLNLLTGFAATILAGLGSDYGIYLVTRFDQERSKAKDFETACQLTFAGTGRATYLSMLTTVVAFVGLCFSGLDVLVEFGLIGAFGLLMTYLATMFVMPALMSLLERKKAPKEEYPSRFVPHSGHSALFKILFFPTKGFFTVGLALTLVMVCLVTLPRQFKIQFIDDLNVLKTPSNKLYDRVSSSIGASLNPTILITKSEAENNRLSVDLRETLKTSPDTSLVYNNIIDYSQLVPRFQREKKELIGRIHDKFQKIKLPMTNDTRRFSEELKTSLNTGTFTEIEIPERIKKFFLSPRDPSIFAAYLFPAFPRISADSMKRYQQGVNELKEVTPVNFAAVDGSFLAADAVRVMEEKMPAAIVLLLLFLAAILIIMIRPPLVALLSLVHLLAGVVIISGIMYFCGISFNILNIGCLPIVLGTGIDVFIHYSYRCTETGSLWEALREEVSPMLMSCLTTVIGFGGLIFTTNSGLRSIGWLAVIGVAVIFLLGAFVYPRVMGMAKRLIRHSNI